MSAPDLNSPDVYDAREIARAAGRPLSAITTLIDSGRVSTLDGEYVSHAEALRVLRAVRTGQPLDVVAGPRPLFSRVVRPPARQTQAPFAASTAVHGLLVAAALLLAFIGRTQVTEALTSQTLAPVRLVFLATPGPGGGGGGGGARELARPRPARREGRSELTSPVPPPDPPRAPEPEPREPEAAPPQAPVASVAADRETTTGVIEESSATAAGPGRNGPAGTGDGGGIGAGDGAGIGDGSGGGTGGGPYRPGSGIEPPSLIVEVKPQYPEEARRRGLVGDVVLEIVVRRDGTVGDVRIVRPLGGGLDQHAVEAVRQWRFEPARRRGVPVDVLVEVSVEFALR